MIGTKISRIRLIEGCFSDIAMQKEYIMIKQDTKINFKEKLDKKKGK
jgi:hypothetical protein